MSPEAIDIVVLAADPAAVAAEAAQVDGVSKVLTVANEANAHAIAHVLAPQVTKLAEGYSHVFAPSTTFGQNMQHGVAALLAPAPDTDILPVQASHPYKRPTPPSHPN